MNSHYEDLMEYSRKSIENIIGEKVPLEELPKIFVTDNKTFQLSLIKVLSHLDSYHPDDDTNQEVYFVIYKGFYYFLLIPNESAYKFNIYNSSTLNDVLKLSISISLFPCLLPKKDNGDYIYIYMNNLDKKFKKEYSCSIKTFNDCKWILKIMEYS